MRHRRPQSPSRLQMQEPIALHPRLDHGLGKCPHASPIVADPPSPRQLARPITLTTLHVSLISANYLFLRSNLSKELATHSPYTLPVCAGKWQMARTNDRHVFHPCFCLQLTFGRRCPPRAPPSLHVCGPTQLWDCWAAKVMLPYPHPGASECFSN